MELARGGYPCPVPWCTETFVVPSLLADHIATEHPEEST